MVLGETPAMIDVFWSHLPGPESADGKALLKFLESQHREILAVMPKRPGPLLRSLAARQLALTQLRPRLGKNARGLEIRKDQVGRPHFHSDDDQILPYLSISHVMDSVAVAISAGCVVGIDIEDETRRSNWLDIARRFFPDSEFQDIAGRRSPGDRHRFFELWTQKEALGKAGGGGVLPLLDLPITSQDEYDLDTFRPDEARVISVAWPACLSEGDMAAVGYKEIPASTLVR